MITKDQMFEPLLAADPSFAPQWEDFLREWQNEEEKPLYLALGDLARHLIDRIERNDVVGLDRVFEVVERWHVEGDDYVSEAATIGFLEGLQNWLGGEKPSRRERERLVQIEGYLGPESLRWWKKLYQFWGGQDDALSFES